MHTAIAILALIYIRVYVWSLCYHRVNNHAKKRKTKTPERPILSLPGLYTLPYFCYWTVELSRDQKIYLFLVSIRVDSEFCRTAIASKFLTWLNSVAPLLPSFKLSIIFGALMA